MLKKSNLNRATSEADILELIHNCSPGGWPDNFEKWNNVKETFRNLQHETAKSLTEYPKDRFNGKGIIMCGGGPRYFPSVYVNLKIIRMLGIELPIQLWYLGDYEMDFKMRKMIEEIGGIECIDAKEIEKQYSSRILAGWELKVYSCINSPFKETFLLDADNTPLRNLEYIMNSTQYKNTGAILWPDYECWKHDSNFWEIIGIKEGKEPQVESGQVLINKSQCWKEINMAKYYCDYSDYYFKIFYGDKETFHLGWRYFDTPYAQPFWPDWVGNEQGNFIIIQRDFNNRWLFSHRAQAKFTLNKSHPICMNVPLEAQTLELLDELNRKWDGTLWLNQTPTQEEKVVMQSLYNKDFIYERIGIDKRLLSTSVNCNLFEAGNDRMERHFQIFIHNNEKIMVIHGDSEPTSMLKLQDDGSWKGHWFKYEQCNVELTPTNLH